MNAWRLLVGLAAGAIAALGISRRRRRRVTGADIRAHAIGVDHLAATVYADRFEATCSVPTDRIVPGSVRRMEPITFPNACASCGREFLPTQVVMLFGTKPYHVMCGWDKR